MAGEVVVDALPYIDQGYDEPGVREAVSTTINKYHSNAKHFHNIGNFGT